MRVIVIAIFFITLTFIPVLSRKHKLVLIDDMRKYFSITTFGFFSDGQLEVRLNNLSFLKKYDGVFGLTLTKTVSDSITPYMESHQNRCLLVDDTLTSDGNIEIISFVLSPSAKEVQVNCSRLSAFLDIQPSADSNTSTIEPPKKPRNILLDFQNAPPQIIKQKRAAVDEKEIMEDKDKKDTETSTPINHSKAVTGGKEVAKGDNALEEINALDGHEETPHNDEETPHNDVLPVDPDLENKQTSITDGQSVPRICMSKKLMYKQEIHDDYKRLYDLKFVVNIKSKTAEGLYSLFFHNCAGTRQNSVPVNLTITITEKNGDSYLSAGEIPLPRLYFLMSVIFLVAGCIWISILRRKKEEVFKIHYLMGLLVFVKSLSLLFHGINFYIIGKDGSPMEAWAVLYYITHLLKGALLFITIVLIGTGWAFIKHILSDKDKKIFMIVIPLQVLANVAKIIMEESEEGDSQHYTWREVFILVDLVCCGAILFPVVWSIRHLQEASHIDGKAAINLEKLKLFRRFYIMIVCYIYFTRIIVYLLKITVPFEYEWMDEMFRETATLIFFILTGYNFRPTTSNPYFRLSQEDDLEMEVVLTQTGFTEHAVKTVRSREISSENAPTKRESSHEYD